MWVDFIPKRMGRRVQIGKYTGGSHIFDYYVDEKKIERMFSRDPTVKVYIVNTRDSEHEEVFTFDEFDFETQSMMIDNVEKYIYQTVW